MLLAIIRAIFVVIAAGVGWQIGSATTTGEGAANPLQNVLLCIGVALIVLAVDVLFHRKSLSTITAVCFGLLVGFLISFLFTQALRLIFPEPKDKHMLDAVSLLLTVVFSYLGVSLILQTKDDFRFVIPYIEFRKETRGGRPLILDTSVIIDGRIADIAASKIIDNVLVVPRFVLAELQSIADSPDKLKRNRGRRGLDVLKKLQSNESLQVEIHEGKFPDIEDVDNKLLLLARKLEGRIITNDYNLNKIAQLHSVDVVNINDLANAMKPVVLPGEPMVVRLVKHGEEAGQGVGYLDDGTMVVVEQGRDRIGDEVELVVTSVLQTSAGRMIFGRLADSPPRKPHGRQNQGQE
jgi:uncharacterized protein YacL